ncbi:MAG: ATP synthase F0 subunit B [Deltaproteobacteria bacterium]|jgi:F-type H+-transporting ATPase subunit b|nr:ATP synthase F0 subunit B [Deltaproteobacteria bacterium]MBK8238407.1 ATP synthase F0 subunit B [Deltaproteobacteria bacterium]MBK8717236.1 ATP synthase F0 subunit B [Deltaproteobacteria bacterium]MBP7286114.1 ATP synthase F0 subunit B [Nannocystaceae bacterium]
MDHAALLSTLTDALPSSLALVGAPVVDIDGTLFVQGGIFLALVVILNPLLFKPWLATQARRAEAIDGAARKAVALEQEADALVKDYDAKLAAARDQAADLRGAAHREEEQAQAAKLATAREAASAEATAARERIARESEAARTELSGRVDELAQTIASKLLGRGAA